MCVGNSQISADYAKRFAHRHLSFLGLGEKRSGTELIRTNRMENGIGSPRT